MKKLARGGIILLIVTLGLVLLQYFLFEAGTGGVERIFEKESVSPGETIKIELDIRLSEDQTYYFIEETVPEEFIVLNDIANKNKIRLAKIQNAESNIFSYEVKAPEEKGTYIFSGEYGMELINGTKNIEGATSIIVE
jgi:hypothetical protein